MSPPALQQKQGVSDGKPFAGPWPKPGGHSQHPALANDPAGNLHFQHTACPIARSSPAAAAESQKAARQDPRRLLQHPCR
eukprot:1573903-Lingulodinium_polyedra.AAC.1